MKCPFKPSTKEAYLDPSLKSIIATMEDKGHAVFTNDKREFNVNIVGIRDSTPKLDEYGCMLTIFWRYQREWFFHKFPATTFPGSTYLVERLLNREGAAILVPGQYRGVYALAQHGGRYEALCQRKGPVRVYRDGDRDREFDMDPRMIRSGWYGINVHAPVTPSTSRASYIADRVRSSSAGCQVFQNMEDFLLFRDICRSARKRFGNSFTYTLLEEAELTKITRR